MNTPSRPGWYPNPDDPHELRYFDGIVWTSHTTTLRARPQQERAAEPEQSEQSAQPAGEAPPAPPTPPHPPPAQLPPVRQQVRGPSPTAAIAGEPELAPYPLRVIAYVIDSIIVTILSLILGGWFFFKAVGPVLDRVESAMLSGEMAAINTALLGVNKGYFAAYLGVHFLIFLAYHVVGLTRWGATPGKLLTGVSVRRIDRPGVLDTDTAIRRAGFQAVVQALGNVPLLSLVASAVAIADLIWPLPDQLNQSLHDKLAGTIVVKGRVQRSPRPAEDHK